MEFEGLIKHPIFVSEDLVIEYYTREIPSDILAFTANGLFRRAIEDGVILNGMGFYGPELYKNGYDIIAIKNNAYDYYTGITPNVDKIVETILSFIKDKYKRKVFFGGCASSWVSLLLSKPLEFDTVFLQMPRNEILATDCDNKGVALKIDLDKDLVSSKCHYILCCNFNHEWDHENLLRFSDVIDKNNRTVVNIPDDPLVHDIILTVKKYKVWKRFIFNILRYGKIIEHPGLWIQN